MIDIFFGGAKVQSNFELTEFFFVFFWMKAFLMYGTRKGDYITKQGQSLPKPSLHIEFLLQIS